MSRAARRNKHKPLFQEAPVERRATVEVADANPPWDARQRERIMKMEGHLQQGERIWVGIEEVEQALLGSGEKVCIATVAELVLDDGGYKE